MEFRLATEGDLQQLKAVFREIVQRMNETGVEIWDEIYPCEFFANDIKNKQLYVLCDNDVIASAFALCSESSGADYVNWAKHAEKALYIDRFGVNINYLKQGIGSFMLGKAKETAKNLGADSLRLFVVDINTPAINLYLKNGFTKAGGIYSEVIDSELTLSEYGFEFAL